MAIFSTADQLLAAFPGHQARTYKVSVTSDAIGAFQSLFFAGGFPAAAGNPSSTPGQTYDDTSAGAIPLPWAGADTVAMARLDVSAPNAAMLLVMDRLVAVSGLSGTSTAAQTVNSATLPRVTTGAGVELWLEWYSVTGATASTATISYTNQAGTAGRTATCSMQPGSGAPVAYQCHPATLQTGDTGVRSVQTVTLSATTGTAGDFGIVLQKPIATVVPPTAVDAFGLGLPEVEPDACITLVALTNTTTTGVVGAAWTTVKGP